jgi:hypothetical protein
MSGCRSLRLNSLHINHAANRLEQLRFALPFAGPLPIERDQSSCPINTARKELAALNTPFLMKTAAVSIALLRVELHCHRRS